MTPEESELRLRDFERNCEIIYPAIRFWGLCGADTRYVIAATEIGRLLGKIDNSATAGPAVDPQKIAADATRDAILSVAAWIETSGEVGAKTGRGLRGELAEMVKKLAQ